MTETVDVTYFQVRRNAELGPRLRRSIPARRGENPFMAAERALKQRYKVRDFVILDAHLTVPPGPAAPMPPTDVVYE